MAEWAATFGAKLNESEGFSTSFSDDGSMGANFGDIVRVSTDNYEELANKPKINGVTLIGDRSFEELGEETLTNTEIKTIFNRVFGG